MFGIALVVDDIRKGASLAHIYPPDLLQFSGLTRSCFASLFRPNISVHFEVVVGSLRYICHTCAIDREDDDDYSLSRFTIVFVVSNWERNNALWGAYRQAAKQLSCALTHEERRSRYISDSVSKAEEMLLDNPTSKDCFVENTVLSSDFTTVFHRIQAGGPCLTRINNWIQVSIPPLKAIKGVDSVKPFHTLLLIKDEREILEELSRDVSPLLRSFVKYFTPFKTLHQIAIDRHVEWKTLLLLVDQFCFWNLGRIITVLSAHSILAVSPTAELNPTLPAHVEFASTFPGWCLLDVLGLWSRASSQTISSAMSNYSSVKQNEFLSILVWLLQRNFLRQLHVFVHLNLQPALEAGPVRSNRLSDSVSEQQPPDELDQSLLLLEDPKSIPPLTAWEKKAIHVMALDTVLYRLLCRLWPLLRGFHTVEDIIWRGSVTKGDLCSLLTAFSDVLVCCAHEVDECEE